MPNQKTPHNVASTRTAAPPTEADHLREHASNGRAIVETNQGNEYLNFKTSLSIFTMKINSLMKRASALALKHASERQTQREKDRQN